MVHWLLMTTIAISKFKATCLKLLEVVRQSGRPLLITKNGEPIAQVMPPPRKAGRSSFGMMKERTRIHGDIIAPALDPGEWAVFKS